jgi:hypothetical protein
VAGSRREDVSGVVCPTVANRLVCQVTETRSPGVGSFRLGAAALTTILAMPWSFIKNACPALGLADPTRNAVERYASLQVPPVV